MLRTSHAMWNLKLKTALLRPLIWQVHNSLRGIPDPREEINVDAVLTRLLASEEDEEMHVGPQLLQQRAVSTRAVMPLSIRAFSPMGMAIVT